MSDTVEQSGRAAGDDLADIPSFVDARTLRGKLAQTSVLVLDGPARDDDEAA